MNISELTQSSQVDEIVFQIDYHIIEHFSKHLYGSPNKAIEELVVNGYDAGANWVNVYLPGEFTSKILVWDDGMSMNTDGLKGLWRVADSPKRTIKDRVLNTARGESRKMIGKFGIGKIASYTLGNQMTHICKTGGEFLFVSIDYLDLMAEGSQEKKGLKTEQQEILTDKLLADGSLVTELSKNLPDGEIHKTGTNKNQYKSPIVKISTEEAKRLLQSQFNKDKIPKNFDELFNAETWTFAIVDNLKETGITSGMLKWVLGNAMPIQPGFKVFVNEAEISSTLLKNGIICNWDFSQSEIISHLKSKWSEGVKAGSVSGELTFGTEIGIDPDNPTQETPYVEFPNLKRIWGNIRLYNQSLLDNRSSETGRSYGFFIMVRKRLINSKDDKVLLHDPSFSTFYSSQFILNIDSLDEDLLADRERIQAHSVRGKELQLLQRAVYLTLVNKQKVVFQKLAEEASIQHRLPVDSPEYFMQPLAALWVNEGGGQTLGFDFRDPKIMAKPLGVEKYISDFSSQEGFQINSSHPYYQNLSRLLGGSKHGQKVVQEFEVVAISEKLFEGFLFEIGIAPNHIDEIKKWRDEMYRKIAKRDSKNLNQLAENLREASYKSGALFENAIKDVLEAIGFIAERDGSSGKEDVFVKAFCGDGSYKLIFEAKGCSSDKALPNDSAETGGANGHRKYAGADHAVIVTRKFAGFDRGNELPAILKECNATEGNVSIMEVEALIAIMYAVKEHSYSLETLKDVFTSVESPIDKLKRISQLQQPLNNFDYSELLNRIWDYQGGTGNGTPVACRHIWQQYYMKDPDFTYNKFNATIESLRTIAFPLITYLEKEVALTQSPDNIISYIQNKFNNSNNKQ